ncbi:MAG: hypothetical protein M3O21_01350 [Chloroflexota bacterium]|nr:hypothetical protein [Chloroflexota bacterium]
MAWLRKKSVVVAEPEVVEAVETATGLPLGVLVPDSGGISSFRLTMHRDAASAEAQIGALRADVRRGTHAFWAMHERPVVDDTMHVEAIVLIRAKPDDDIVYVVSFLDIESALSFTRFELRRGLHIRNVMIYWAAFTQVREEMEGVSIIPTVAPPTVADVAPFSPDPRLAPAGQPAPQASVAVAEPEPDTASSVESEARAAVERYLRENPEKAGAVPAAEAPATEEPIAVAESSIASEEPTVVDEPEADESLWPPARGARTPVISDEPATVEQAAVQEALVLQHPPVAEPVAEPEPPTTDPYVSQRQQAEWTQKRRWAPRDKRRQSAERPEVVAGELPEIVAEPVESAAGDEEAEREEPTATRAALDPAEGLPKAAQYDEFDIALEVEQLLKNRKWETRNGPFSGFKSPPGRF